MSTSTTPDVQVSRGISPELAMEARESLLATARKAQESILATASTEPPKVLPVTWVGHTAVTRKALKSFLEDADKNVIAQALGIDVSDVHKRFRGSKVGISNPTTPLIYSTGLAERFYSILAFGDLSFDNGLSAFGQSEHKVSLCSGEVVHFWADIRQKYTSKDGGGTLMWITWTNVSS